MSYPQMKRTLPSFLICLDYLSKSKHFNKEPTLVGLLNRLNHILDFLLKHEVMNDNHWGPYYVPHSEQMFK